MEQMTYPKMLKEVCERVRQKDIVEVWDYSQVNVDILKSQGIQARHVPLQTTPEDVAKLKSYIPSKPEFDVGFCGVVPDRRMRILQQLGEKGLKVVLCNTTYGEERDRILAKCRVQLNIHQTDVHKVYESTRCNHWLDAGIPVISETSLDDDPRCINVSYDALVETVVKFCKDPAIPLKNTKLQWIDSTLFNGDLIVQLRLQYLYPHVDKIYICEQRYTHQGTKKDVLYFDLYKDWFTPYKDKLVFLVDETPYSGETWVHENAHRNYAATRIVKDNKDTQYIVTVCDCDELPDVAMILGNMERIYETTREGALYMEQQFFYYNLNWYMSKWYSPFIMNNTLLTKYKTFQGFRDKVLPHSVDRMFPCGWHCSYFMPTQEILRKIRSFAHLEHNIPSITDETHIIKSIETGTDLFKRAGTVLYPSPIPLEQFPKEFRQFHRYILSLQQQQQ